MAVVGQDARDEDEPKPAIIVLIIKAIQAKAAATAGAAARAAATQRAQKAELEQLKLPELRKRAAAAGASPGAIEDARDGDHPKAEIIALILATGQQSAQP
jgi:hypothetical protein